MSFICEVKKASPSKGLIKPDYNYLDIAQIYENNDASAVSCLTEPTKFLGNLEHLNTLSKNIDIPLLRKDFVVDEYMIYEAKLNGASAILLICAILEEDKLKEFLDLAHSLDLDALVEVHNLEDLQKALNVGARIIGINNRDLRNFNVSLDTTLDLLAHIPEEKIIVSESGIHTKDDLKLLANNKINAVLIGEAFMKSEDIAASLNDLRNYED